MSDPLELSVVIPVFNGEGTLRTLLDELSVALAARDYEVILVDDGSRDSSWEVIREMAAESSRVVGLGLMRNYGQHNALLAGIRSARGAIIVTMDDDLQHPPSEIPKLIAQLDRGFDVAYGKPIRMPHSLFRNVSSTLTKLALARAMGAETARNVSAFRAFNARLREAFATYGSPYVSIDVLLTWATTRFTAVPVRHDRREAGRSNYRLPALMTHALTMLTGFSIWPLRVATLVGFCFTIFGIGVLAYVLTMFMTHGRVVPGFAFLASITAIFSGAQLFTLGVLGEYLARMHVRLMDQPAYVVGRSTAGPRT